MIEKFLKALLGKDAIFGAAGIGDSAVAASLFAALRGEPTSLWLTDAPETLRYAKGKDGKHSQAVIIPGILNCCDMPELLKHAKGTVRQFFTEKK